VSAVPPLSWRNGRGCFRDGRRARGSRCRYCMHLCPVAGGLRSRQTTPTAIELTTRSLQRLPVRPSCDSSIERRRPRHRLEPAQRMPATGFAFRDVARSAGRMALP
jgi:hypothetical protein